MSIQTILALGALVLLTTIMMNFYTIFGSNWETVDGSQLGLDATTLAISYFEIAHGLAFDARALDEHVDISSPDSLTLPGDLGPDEVGGVLEQLIADFDDFDDFHGYIDTMTIAGAGTYVSQFEVYYVDPANLQVQVNEQTYLKRLDVRIWRIEPPMPANAGMDTIRMWTAMAYFTYQEEEE